ncbi:MAG: uroporphyrinogen-III C-methyltransferase [Gammaproteobacteria bacterium]|nr:uroporphyrinogen-III C-methyltransferase [Gammaproteobacteria bacterium]
MSEKDTSAPENPENPAASAALESEPADANGNETPPASTTPERRGGGSLLGGVALVLALLALGASGYLWYQGSQGRQQAQMQQQLTSQTVDSELKSLAQNLGFLKEQQSKLEDRQKEIDGSVQTTLKETVEPLSTSQAELTKSVEQLTQSVEKVYADLDRSLDSWALEEVEQLLRIANHSVTLSRDPATALAGLELADRRLQALGDPRLTEVRTLVADEITQLKALAPVDTAGLALKLKSMADAVDGLPLAHSPEKTVGAASDGEATQPDAGTQSAWLSTARELWSDLKSQVRIQNTAQPAKPLLAPEQRYFLTANLRLMLESAQIALLRSDTETYRSNLSQSRAWMEQYFDVNEPAVSSMIKDLEDMAGIELRPELPRVDQSLGALQKLKNRT